jgi:hypothetical protein
LRLVATLVLRPDDRELPVGAVSQFARPLTKGFNMADPAIKVIPTAYQDVLALMRSEALGAVEQPVAAAVGLRLLEDYATTIVSALQADLSVSGMTVADAEALLLTHRDRIIAFGIAFLRDKAATDDAEEYPEGEEQDPPGPGTVLGLSAGFGITHAIYFNFLTNRPAPDFRAYLKNRRIPHQAKFAKELRRLVAAD